MVYFTRLGDNKMRFVILSTSLCAPLLYYVLTHTLFLSLSFYILRVYLSRSLLRLPYYTLALLSVIYLSPPYSRFLFITKRQTPHFFSHSLVCIICVLICPAYLLDVTITILYCYSYYVVITLRMPLYFYCTRGHTHT